MIFEILFIGSLILGGIVIAWTIENVLPKVIGYLKTKLRQEAIISKGNQINEWIKNTRDPEIIAELRAIKDAHQALVTPLTTTGEYCYEEVVVLKPEDATGEDRMADAVLIRANGTYQEL